MRFVSLINICLSKQNFPLNIIFVSWKEIQVQQFELPEKRKTGSRNRPTLCLNNHGKRALDEVIEFRAIGILGVGKTRDGHHGHVILDRYVPVTDTSRNHNVSVTETIFNIFVFGEH